MPKKTELIIFDANFFIMLLSVGVRHTIDNLDKVAEQLSFEYYISEMVFNEIKAPHTYKEKLKKVITVEKILNSEIDIIKTDLLNHNVRFPAQDPDLSLIVLADRLKDNDETSSIYLVSDDFKLIKNTNIIFSGNNRK